MAQVSPRVSAKMAKLAKIWLKQWKLSVLSDENALLDRGLVAKPQPGPLLAINGCF